MDNLTDIFQNKLVINYKKKILLLFDLNGTIIYRSKKTGKVYIRPHLEQFKELESQVIIGIYSSMLLRNITKILPQLPINISVIFDRSFTSPDTDSLNNFDTIRNLDLIMQSDFIINNKIVKENIILVDNESRKVRFCKENSIIISEFYPINKDDYELINLKLTIKNMLLD